MINKLITLFVFVSFSSTLLASNIRGCKFFNDEMSGQLSFEKSSFNGKKHTYLIFSKAIAWYPDLTRFELVHSTYSNEDNSIDDLSLTFVANAISLSGQYQTVEIALEPKVGNVRNGIMRAGDFVGEIGTTLKKHKDYNIQCYF